MVVEASNLEPQSCVRENLILGPIKITNISELFDATPAPKFLK